MASIDRRTDPEAWFRAVYSDTSLTTQWDDGNHTGTDRGNIPTCSNSQPAMVFSMLAALDVQPGSTVLEVGTGTGWNAALLSERVGSEHASARPRSRRPAPPAAPGPSSRASRARCAAAPTAPENALPARATRR
ncbi:hypothetical protein [Streptomyces avidinii]